MNTIVVTSTKQNIKFGYEGEDNVTKIIFPYDESWLEYGEGNFEVRILRCGDEVAYTATDVVDDRQAMTLTMTVTDIELSVRGRGEMQLCYVCPDSIKKSPIYQYTVNRSVDYKYAVDPPEGSIIASVEKSLSEIKNTTNRLSNSVISIESSINDVNSQIDNINNKISEFDEEIDSVGEVETKVDNLETSIESINGRINTAEGNINENTESISDLNESVTELENKKVTDLETSGGKSDSGKYLTVGTDGKIKATSLTIPPKITVDESLSTTSKNPVQNKVIKTELNNINSNIATCNTEISKINGSLAYASSIGRKGSTVLPNTYIVQGTYVNGEPYADKKRICTKKIDVYKDEVIDIVNGTVCVNLRVAFIDVNGTYSALSWSSNNKTVTVPYDGQFTCTFAKEDFSLAISPSEYDATITFKSLTSVELSNHETRFEVLENEIEVLENEIGEVVTPDKTSFFISDSHNKINPENIDISLYFSPSSGKITTSNARSTYAFSGLIPVEEGETYTASGTGISIYGGYFGESAESVIDQQAILFSIERFLPVTGDGWCFTVPSNLGIKYVGINLNKDPNTQEINGTYQIEKGEMATPIVPYNPEWKIMEQYLPDIGTTDEVSALLKLPDISYDSAEKAKISNFIAHWLAKDKDLMVVGTGTSLTARSSEHCTLRDDATSRPPLMHSNNFASKIWDIIKWEGQRYRRFDYTGFFTETGTFASTHNLENWDDNNYRYGLTRYADGGASVQYTIPADAWQANFIYRTDSAGCESASVEISEGNGVMVVWNGSTWVEANGYTFSMKQEVVELTNVSVHNPNTTDNSKAVITNYQVGGNTTYQKRLKMKAVTRTATKTITISATSGRFLYWGVEWSPREFMITYVNSARGSHSMSYDSTRSLARFQDNEVWSFNPDLIFTENPIHNSGGAGADIVGYHTTYWGYITNDFFFNTDDPISFVSRATANGIDVSALEWIIFTSSLSWNFGGIDDDGELKLYADADGKVMSALDAQTLAYKWILDNETNVVAINACQYWCDAGFRLFGSLKDATVGSGKSGSTFTNEGSHWNNTGCAVMAKCIAPIFDFYY